MTTPLKPPRGLFVPTAVIFDHSLPAPLRDTLVQLMALAWRAQGHSTPLVSYEVLAALTGKSKRTLQGHIADLRDQHTALRLQSAGGGDFVIVFDPRLWTTHRQRKNLHTAVKEDKESIQDLINPPSVPVQTEDLTPANQRGDAEISADPTQGLGSDLAGELLKDGLFPDLLAEVGRSGYAPETLMGLLEWSRADNPQKPAGLFMVRLRAGAKPPERYTYAPCPRCGQVGAHAPSCYMRYVSPGEIRRDPGDPADGECA